MNPLEEAKHLYLSWELSKLKCEPIREHIEKSNFISDGEKSILENQLIVVISKPLNNGVSSTFRNDRIRWRRDHYPVEKLELANQVGDLPRRVHRKTLSEILCDLPDREESITMDKIIQMRETLNAKHYDPIIIVEPADRESTTGATGTILDGNKRSIALALSGLERIAGLVGNRMPWY